MNEFVVWYLLISTVPGAAISYPKPIGPFTQAQCQRVREIHLKSELAPAIASCECKKAAGLKTCVDSDGRAMTCPIF